MQDLRQLLDAWDPVRGARYAAGMWRHTLEQHAAGAPLPAGYDGSGALPYLPVMPESLGCAVSSRDEVLDAGCLGGHGLFDLAARRRAAGLAMPRLTGVDNDPESLALARYMAAGWRESAEAVFHEACAEKLPFGNGRFKVAIGRLLLPYTRIGAALNEFARTLAPGGLLYLQVHGPGYYLEQLSRNRRRPRTLVYYMRPLIACAFMKVRGRQPASRWFRETAMTGNMLRRAACRRGLRERWRDPDRRRPFAVFTNAC